MRDLVQSIKNKISQSIMNVLLHLNLPNLLAIQ